VAGGFLEAALAGGRQQVIGAPARRLGAQPFFLGEAEHRGAYQAFIELQGLQEADQAAQPDPAAAGQHGVTENRDDEGAGLHAALLAEVVETFLDRGKHLICRVNQA
jgi:hypothetical protein